jgi:hypothetical protein
MDNRQKQDNQDTEVRIKVQRDNKKENPAGGMDVYIACCKDKKAKCKIINLRNKYG